MCVKLSKLWRTFMRSIYTTIDNRHLFVQNDCQLSTMITKTYLIDNLLLLSPMCQHVSWLTGIVVLSSGGLEDRVGKCGEMVNWGCVPTVVGRSSTPASQKAGLSLISFRVRALKLSKPDDARSDFISQNGVLHHRLAKRIFYNWMDQSEPKRKENHDVLQVLAFSCKTISFVRSSKRCQLSIQCVLQSWQLLSR